MIELNLLETLPNEVWKFHPIGVAVSNLGRIFVPQGGRGIKSHYTYGCVNKHGYLRIKKKQKMHLIHRLVAECFIENPNDYPTVDHINRNKTDNRVENLRWSTYSMQVKNRGVYKRPNAPKNNAQSKQVIQINPSTNEIIRIYPSTMECHRYGFDCSAVSKCCKNKFNRIGNNIYKGYKWQYVA